MKDAGARRYNVFEGDCSTRPQERYHFPQRNLAGWNVEHHQPFVHEVELGFWQAGVQGIAMHDLDIVQATTSDFRTHHREKSLLSLQSDNRASHANSFRQEI
jgi:hypothetical protein